MSNQQWTLERLPGELQAAVDELRARMAQLAHNVELLVQEKEKLQRRLSEPVTESFIQSAEAAKTFGISKGTWFAWRRRGIISAGVSLGRNRTGWPASEVRALYERLKNGTVTVTKKEANR